MNGLPDLPPLQSKKPNQPTKQPLMPIAHVEPKQPEPNETYISDEEKFKISCEKIMKGESGLSYSSGSQLLSCPNDYYVYKTGKQEQTKAMIEGQQFHMATLEPEVFDSTYWVLDDTEKVEQLLALGFKKARSSKDYKDWRAEQELKNLGKELIDGDWFFLLKDMESALLNNSASGPLMKNLTEKEQKFEFDYDGILFRGKIDGYGVMPADHPIYPEGGFTADLKKVADARFRKVKWDIKEKNYDFQGALYSNAKGTRRHFLIYIDKQCHITVVQLSEDSMNDGEAKIERVVESFIDCYENNNWQASYEYYNGPYTLF